MNDFESLIHTMMTNGASAEDIMKQTNEILAKIKSSDEKAKKRQDVLDEFANRFYKAYQKNQFTIQNAAEICAFVCARTHPGWTADDINDFFNVMLHDIKMQAELVGKSATEAIKKLVEDSKDFCLRATPAVDIEKTFRAFIDSL